MNVFRIKKNLLTTKINQALIFINAVMFVLVVYIFFAFSNSGIKSHYFIPFIHLFIFILIIILFILILRSRRQQRSIAEENIFKLMFENANDPLAIFNDLIVLDCNTKACELFETTHDKMIGLHISHFSAPFQSNGKALEFIAKEYKNKVQIKVEKIKKK